MKLSLDVFPDRGPNEISPADYYREALDLTEFAEEMGYSSVKIVEHYFYDYGGYSPNPLIFLAAVARRTQTMRLMTGAVLPVFSHPLKLAAELAMLDGISDGRLDAGFARAFLPGEFKNFQRDMEESRGRFDEGMEIILRAWEGKRFSHQGKFFQFEDVISVPPVTQKPRPPVWIAAVASRQSFINAGKNGFNLMVVPYIGPYDEIKADIEAYKQAYREAGHGEPSKEQIMVVMHTIVADSHDEAVNIAQPALAHYLKTFKEGAAPYAQTETKEYAKYSGIGALLDSMTWEKMTSERRIAVGTPDEVADILGYIADFFGSEFLSLQQFFGGITFAQAKRNIELTAREVLPQLQK